MPSIFLPARFLASSCKASFQPRRPNPRIHDSFVGRRQPPGWLHFRRTWTRNSPRHLLDNFTLSNIIGYISGCNPQRGQFATWPSGQVVTKGSQLSCRVEWIILAAREDFDFTSLRAPVMACKAMLRWAYELCSQKPHPLVPRFCLGHGGLGLLVQRQFSSVLD